jgi:hypothetical protein
MKARGRPNIGTRRLLVDWPVAERLGEQRWRIVQRDDGAWDVVLVIDGGYSHRQDAEGVLDHHWREQLARSRVVGVCDHPNVKVHQDGSRLCRDCLEWL